jgi:hypothetical protein
MVSIRASTRGHDHRHLVPRQRAIAFERPVGIALDQAMGGEFGRALHRPSGWSACLRTVAPPLERRRPPRSQRTEQTPAVSRSEPPSLVMDRRATAPHWQTTQVNASLDLPTRHAQ